MNRPRGKKMGIILLAALIAVSLVDVILRAVIMQGAVVTISNMGEPLAKTDL